MRYAIIENGLVANLAVGGDGDFVPPDNWHAVPDGLPVENGDTFDGANYARPVIPINEIRAAMRERVNEIRDRLQNGSVQTPFGRLDCNERSRGFLHGGVTEAMIRQAAGDTTPLTFTTADDLDVSLDPANMIAAGRYVLGYITAVHVYARSLKAEIKARKRAALAALDLTAGWP